MTSFQSRMCLKKDAASFVYRMARNSFFFTFYTTRRDRKITGTKRMVVGVCWQAWQNQFCSGGNKLRVADEEIFGKRERHV